MRAGLVTKVTTRSFVIALATGFHVVPQRMCHNDRPLSALCRLIDTPLRQDKTMMLAGTRHFTYGDKMRYAIGNQQVCTVFETAHMASNQVLHGRNRVVQLLAVQEQRREAHITPPRRQREVHPGYRENGKGTVAMDSPRSV
jgi:hypothetical protein